MGKYYVVWKGKVPGIYGSWGECCDQTKGFPGAEFKSFKTLGMAEKAFEGKGTDFIAKDIFESELTQEQLKLIGDPILNSIVVDAAWNTVSGMVEYQGMDLKTKKLLFHKGPFDDGTNNIGEFLAIVHALAHCKQNGLMLPIYSDSRNAIGWAKDKCVRTGKGRNEKNKELFGLVDRAIEWLNNNKYPNQILKWETGAWGENPADFGRK
jgi:ribonuclease HI